MRLSSTKQWVFFVSLTLGVLAVLLFVFGSLGLLGGGFGSVVMLAYWLAVIAWALLAVGVAFKGI